MNLLWAAEGGACKFCSTGRFKNSSWILQCGTPCVRSRMTYAPHVAKPFTSVTQLTACPLTGGRAPLCGVQKGAPACVSLAQDSIFVLGGGLVWVLSNYEGSFNAMLWKAWLSPDKAGCLIVRFVVAVLRSNPGLYPG